MSRKRKAESSAEQPDPCHEAAQLASSSADYQWIDIDQGRIIASAPMIVSGAESEEVSEWLKNQLPLVPEFYLNFIDTYFDGDIPDSIFARLANFPNQLCCTALLDHIAQNPETPLVKAGFHIPPRSVAYRKG